MKFRPTKIPDVLLIEPTVHGDERGFFMEVYEENKFAEGGIPDKFVQDNYAGSKQGILRGMHYQIYHGQGKLVRAGAGEIYDVAVDVRRNSPTFGQWVGAHLSAENRHQLWVPVGFAHGYYVLSEWAEVSYKVTDIYVPDACRYIAWDDPAIGIDWPLVNGQTPILSKADTDAPTMAEADLFE